jgi:Flp pilus assembly protein TadG
MSRRAAHRATHRAARRPRGERGTAAVEFALILPMFLALVVGTITVGFTFSDHLALSTAIREGSRFASATDYTQTTWATSVRDRVEQAYQGTGSTLTDAEICVVLRTNAGTSLASWTGSDCGAEPASPTPMSSGSCVAKVWAQVPGRIELIVSSPLVFHLRATTLGFYGRTVGSCVAD